MIRDTDCDKVEAEILELFREIRSVSSPDSSSLEEAVDRAIIEGRNFKQWQESMLPLGNVCLFQNTDDGLLPAGKIRMIRFPFLRLFRKKIGAGGSKSRLEIWNCDKNNQPVFPLSRIGLTGIRETGPLRLEEPLRDDLFLNIEIWRNEQNVFVKAGLSNRRSKISRIAESVRNLNTIGAETLEYWQKTIKVALMEGALPLLLIVSSMVMVPAIMLLHHDTDRSRDNNYSRSNPGPDEDQILGQKCFKQMCGDPKYLSDTDTVNGA
jgi:hypothetical protein